MFRYIVFPIVLLLLLTTGGAEAARLTTLHAFCAQPQGTKCLDGETPVSRLVEVGGAFYGTASAGGERQLGTLFRVSTGGGFTTLHSFCQEVHCSDGARPGNYLTRGPFGNVYGVTAAGGLADGGTVFRLSSSGAFSLVHKFCSLAKCADGIQPVSVLFDGNGGMIGTAAAGGSHGGGTVFTIDSGGTFRVLHDFCAESGCTDGASPGALVRGKDGNFYGTTLAGGKNHAGTMFRMTPAGTVTILYSFCGANKCPNGQQPAAMLVEGQNGDFYGTTRLKGANGYGTVFEISPAGAFRTLHSFCAKPNCSDGATPTDGLILAKDGSFYGAVSAGGLFFDGAVFRLTPAGNYSLVYNFCALHGCFDGASPGSPPILGSNGLLYGTTMAGGDNGNNGTAYRLEP